MTLDQLQTRVLRELRLRRSAPHRDELTASEERAAARLIARADAHPFGRARYLARQAAILRAAGAAGPPIGTD